jgi:hypothetical protein
MSVGHGTIRLLARNDVPLVMARPEPVGHGAIHVGRRPNAEVASLFAASRSRPGMTSSRSS